MTLEAYCWPPSAVRGEAVGLRVSTDASSFDVEVAREGAANEPVWSVEQVTARSHDTPADARPAAMRGGGQALPSRAAVA